MSNFTIEVQISLQPLMSSNKHTHNHSIMQTWRSISFPGYKEHIKPAMHNKSINLIRSKLNFNHLCYGVEFSFAKRVFLQVTVYPPRFILSPSITLGNKTFDAIQCPASSSRRRGIKYAFLKRRRGSSPPLLLIARTQKRQQQGLIDGHKIDLRQMKCNAINHKLAI